MRHIVLLFIIAVHAINRVIHIISRNDFGADTLWKVRVGLNQTGEGVGEKPIPISERRTCA